MIRFKIFDFKRVTLIEMLKLLTKLRAQSLKTQVAFYYKKHGVEKPTIPLPTRPTNLQEAKFTNFIEDKNEFENVKRLIPSPIVPEPPKHSVYPTPSGWLPPDLTKSSKLPYFVLRTRFHNFPIYPIEREGGSRKLVRIRYIEGDIWVKI